MDPIIQKFRDKFIEEANSLLDRLEKDMLELENSPGSKEIIESAFRAAHTLKGVSAMYGFEHISDYIHHFESIFQAIKEGKISINREISDITFTSIDHVRKLLCDEKLKEESLAKEHSKLLVIVKDVCHRTLNISVEKPQEQKIIVSEKTEAASSWHIILNANEQMFFRGISILNIFRELSSLGEYKITRFKQENNNVDVWSIILKTTSSEDDIREVFLFVEDDCTFNKLPDNWDVSQNIEEMISKDKKMSFLEYAESLKEEEPVKKEIVTEQKGEIQNNGKTVNRISVDVAKLNHLMYLVSELITVNSQINVSSQSEIYNPLRGFFEKVDSLSKQFRNNALDIRLVPLSETVLRFQRLIRDLSRNLNKEVLFVTNGIDTELDKTTIDQLSEPLMHIIRNSIDHGIEHADKRIANGKPASGTIKLSAFHSGNNVFIEIEDDGNGIDLEKVRQKAIKLDIIKPIDKPTKKELIDLIFLPGFSTALSLTEVSGRGVGMDVVKRRINDLRGEIIVDSEEGKGTVFTLKLQQSLAIIDTLLFTVNSYYFIVPISDIVLCSQESIEYINQRRTTETIEYNNTLIPFIDLCSFFQIESDYSEKVKIIILKHGDKNIAILANRIVGEHQAVLKPLGKILSNQQYITAASQLGDGNNAFMIDITALYSIYDNNKKVTN